MTDREVTAFGLGMIAVLMMTHNTNTVHQRAHHGAQCNAVFDLGNLSMAELLEFQAELYIFLWDEGIELEPIED